MAAHEKFDFKTLEAVKAKAQELGAGLSFRDDLSPLFQPRKVGGRTAPNVIRNLRGVSVPFLYIYGPHPDNNS